MLWFILALIAAAADAAYFALTKHFLKDIDLVTLAGGVFLATSVFLFGGVLIRGVPAIGPNFWWALIASCIVNGLAAILTFRAFELTDFSLAMPMISFTPMFTIVTSFLLLGELPKWTGAIGILLIAAGAYVLHTTNGMRIFDPIKSMLKDKGVLCMLGVAFLYSFAANFDKIAVQNSDPIFEPALMIGIVGVVFCAARFKKLEARQVPSFILAGGVLAISAAAVCSAFLLEIVPYVISIKRLSILFAVLIGGLVFKEDHLPRRLTGAVIMVVGVVCILLL